MKKNLKKTLITSTGLALSMVAFGTMAEGNMQTLTHAAPPPSVTNPDTVSTQNMTTGAGITIKYNNTGVIRGEIKQKLPAGSLVTLEGPNGQKSISSTFQTWFSGETTRFEIQPTFAMSSGDHFQIKVHAKGNPSASFTAEKAIKKVYSENVHLMLETAAGHNIAINEITNSAIRGTVLGELSHASESQVITFETPNGTMASDIFRGSFEIPNNLDFKKGDTIKVKLGYLEKYGVDRSSNITYRANDATSFTAPVSVSGTKEDTSRHTASNDLGQKIEITSINSTYITGYLRDASNQPIKHVKVRNVLATGCSTAWTDNNGQFRLYNNIGDGRLRLAINVNDDEDHYISLQDGSKLAFAGGFHVGVFMVNPESETQAGNGGNVTPEVTPDFSQNTWEQKGNDWYCYNANGDKVTGWMQDGNHWYYFNSNGAMHTGWLESNGLWYSFRSNGQMKRGWEKINGTQYFFTDTGRLAYDEWLPYGSDWFYVNKKGRMLQNEWQPYNGDWYYFDAKGAMVTNQYVGDSYVDASGRAI